MRLCFHERRLQYMEREQIAAWRLSRPGDRIVEIDVPLSYGIYDVLQDHNNLNVVEFFWDPTKEVGVYIKVGPTYFETSRSQIKFQRVSFVLFFLAWAR